MRQCVVRHALADHAAVEVSARPYIFLGVCLFLCILSLLVICSMCLPLLLLFMSRSFRSVSDSLYSSHYMSIILPLALLVISMSLSLPLSLVLSLSRSLSLHVSRASLSVVFAFDFSCSSS